MNALTKRRYAEIEKYVNANQGISVSNISITLKIDKEKAKKIIYSLADQKKIKMRNYSSIHGNRKPVQHFYPKHFEFNPVVYPNEKVKRFVERALINLFGETVSRGA